MDKAFLIAANVFAITAAVFCVALVLAALGYRNVMVMLWMLAGPLLFMGSVVLLALRTMVRLAARSLDDCSSSPFWAVGMSMLGFVLLKLFARGNLVSGNQLLIEVVAALSGLGLAMMVSRLRVRWMGEGSTLGLALAGWFFDEWLPLSIFATSYVITLSADIQQGRRK